MSLPDQPNIFLDLQGERFLRGEREVHFHFDTAIHNGGNHHVPTL